MCPPQQREARRTWTKRERASEGSYQFECLLLHLTNALCCWMDKIGEIQQQQVNQALILVRQGEP